MKIPFHVSLALPVCVLALLTVGCETAESRRPSAAPPAAATAPTLAPPPPPVQKAAAPAPKIDAVDSTVEQAEREFLAGQANYEAGHMEAARQDFDRAFNILTSGPVEVKVDERLQREFDKVVDGVHTLEMQALREGDGFTEQQSMPAPIDEANDITFPVDPRVKATAEAGLKNIHSDLPLVMNDTIAGYINFYGYSNKGRNTMMHAWTRAGRYRDMIQRVLSEEGVPQDLIYLAQAESGFQPLALSRAGARGMWQFMASRASAYGLERNWWVDERQDPEKSTRAAARHLKDLYEQFGDWYLAMAAYNSGPGNVQQAVQRTGYADFWELYKRNVLPRETKNYVPIIVAIAIIAKTPSSYELDNIEPEPALQFETVTIDYPVDLRLVAECVDTTADVLQDLNPSLLRMTTPRQGSFELRLPAGTRGKFQESIAAIPVDKRVWWRYHKVAAGETLASIARQYKTTASAISEVNGLEASEIDVDTKLIIPIAVGKYAPGEVETLAFSKHPTRYRVRRGDTVLSVADDYGVPPEKLRQWNHLKGNELHKGQRLVIYRPVATPEPKASTYHAASKSKTGKGMQPTTASAKRVHKVRSGETLYSIAQTYGTTVAAIKRDNPKLTSTLHPGDLVIINAP